MVPKPRAQAASVLQLILQAGEYREKVSEAIIDHLITQSVTATVSALHASDARISSNALAKDFLNHAY
jgi:hypothetical protein